MTDNSRNDRRPDRGRPDRGRPGDERASAPKPEAEAPQEDRIAKVIARAGIASRRDAEAMIAEGRVTLNGAVLDSPAVNVTDKDRITVDGDPLPARERTRLWLFHKPRGLVTTARDPEGRPTVFESLPEDLPRVVAIGRLDINTEGLLLLTNDGGLAKVIAHPDTGWMRRYRVRAHGDVTQAELDKLKAGITLEGMDYGPVEATLDRVQGDNVWITLGLREGKNREVKKILEHLGLAVNRLIRLSFGPFQLGELESGLVEEVRTKVLKEQLGTKLAGEAGVDFESPVREPIAPFGSEIRKAKGERPPRRDDRRDRDDRPHRGGSGERPQRGGERDFKSRDRDGGPRSGASRGGQGSDERPRLGGRPERRPAVWRDGGEDRPRHKTPRRGEDPRAARAAAGERPRERVGAIRAPAGGKVLVERLVSQPKPEGERPLRHRRDERRPAPGGDDRPRRPKPPRDPGDRPPRRDREGFGDRPPRPPREGPSERPRGGFRSGTARDDRAGGSFRDDPRKGSGGFKGPGGFKGDRPGGPKREGGAGRGASGGSRPPGGSRPSGGKRPFGGAKGPPRRPRP
jgi:23S rRNA pseudouridine2605 synthase